MYQAFSAIYQQGAIVPLEPMALDENETVIVLRLRPVSTETIKKPVGDAMARKVEEKVLENR